jgi:hypothetical protein
MNTKHKFDRNPFVNYDDLKSVLKFKSRRTRNAGVAVSNDGEIMGNIYASTGVAVDTDEFMKIYFRKTDQWLSVLNNSELVMLEYIFKNTKPGKDTVYIEREQYLLENRLKHNICYYGPINSMMEKKIIARTKMTNWFFINVTQFFNGDRVRYFNNLNKQE